MMLSLSCAALQPLIRNLDRYVALTPDDRAAIAALGDRSQVEKPAHTDIAREGERARVAHAVISGWACCYKDLPDGPPADLSGFLLPGDVFDLNLDSLRGHHRTPAMRSPGSVLPNCCPASPRAAR